MLKTLYLFHQLIETMKIHSMRGCLPIIAVSLYVGMLSGNAAGEALDAVGDIQGRKFTATSSNNFPPVNLLDDNGRLTEIGRAHV